VVSYFDRRLRHSALGYLTPVELEQRLIVSSTRPVAAGNPLFTRKGQPQASG
jgi:hypothetical protein